MTLKLELPYNKGLFGSFAWTTSNAKDFMSAGSIASGSWTSARAINGNNDLSLSTSDFVSPNRLVGVFGYRLEYGKKSGGATSISIGYIGNNFMQSLVFVSFNFHTKPIFKTNYVSFSIFTDFLF